MSLADQGPQGARDEPAIDVGQGARIGPYRLMHEIGRGGMGAVYLGVRDDDAFQKRVAIKVLKRGMDTDSIVRRFRNERQILAGLEHPNIASLLDGGTTPDGRPYFAMEYVEGRPLVDYCETHGLDTAARVRLFRSVCSAVQYAHQNLIIHRDLKPANVLVTADGTPKLLDFGIAKLLSPRLAGHTLAPTVAGLQLMTPEYASPEQVRGDTVTTATDIYSLGVVLYELLTGRRPYRLTSRIPADIARVICESVPVRPSTAVTRIGAATDIGDELTVDPSSAPARTKRDERPRTVDVQRLRRELAGDLDTIALKALSKEPDRRYASVDQLSEDLRRHLEGLPVIARKDTLGYRAAKFVRRNRVAVAAAALTLAALIAGIIGTTWQARVARVERARAEQRFDDVRALANAFLFDIHDAIRDLPGSTPARQLLVTKALEYLDKLARDAGDRADLTRDLAAAYVKVGDVQGRPLTPNLGDTHGALDSYKKATALYESLGADASADATLRRELSTAYLRLSDVLSSAGETAPALQFARKGLSLQQSSSTDASASPDARRELAASYSRVADLLSATGDTKGALEYRRTSLSLMETLAEAEPDDVNNLRQLGVAYSKLGNSLGNPNYPNVGDYRGALQQLERSGEVFERATAAHPQNATFRRNFAVVQSNIADVLIALDRPDEALARQQAALATFQAQADADPTNAAAKNDLAISVYKIAGMLDARGQYLAAIRQYERALAIHQALAASDPENDTARQEVASDHSALGTTQAKVGQRTNALASHFLAVTMSRELSAANAGNVELRVNLALALISRADSQAALARRPSATATRADDRAAAERDYAEAIELLTKLQQEGFIDGTDVETMDKAREALARVRAERKS